MLGMKATFRCKGEKQHSRGIRERPPSVMNIDYDIRLLEAPANICIEPVRKVWSRASRQELSFCLNLTPV
jgi:hypothetical protein